MNNTEENDLGKSSLYADIAFENRQYEEALKWYEKVLTKEPNNLHALSRAGSICVPMKKFREAKEYFKRAIEIDSGNGDNYYNYGNACFFCQDIASAFKSYVDADRIGCSQDVMPRLYYQLALICMMREDYKSCITYFEKCDDCDKDSVLVLSPEFISDKLKLFMILEDHEKAEETSAQLLCIQPNNFQYYMIRYSILIAAQKYGSAEKILDDATKFSDLTKEDLFSVMLLKASLYVSVGEKYPDQMDAQISKAVILLRNALSSEELTRVQVGEASLALAETYYKAEKYDNAIETLERLIFGNKTAVSHMEASSTEGFDADTTIEQYVSRLNEFAVEGKPLVRTDYDDNGEETISVNDDNLNKMIGQTVFDLNDKKDEGNSSEEKQYDSWISSAREKICFMLLSCLMGKEDFHGAQKYSDIMRNSQNKYYRYFGEYTHAYIVRKTELSREIVEKENSFAMAYFRSKSFADPGDTLALTFRVRLYAEDGKYEKAKELIALLPDNDRDSLTRYISECMSS